MLLLDKRKTIIVFILLLLQVNFVFALKLKSEKKVVLNTREYENYRRFILEIPENATNIMNSFIKPEIISNADSGLFSILIKSENVQLFEGEKLRKSEGRIPVRFTISYPDSHTIKIDGKTIDFDNIVSFYIIDENKYVFDIYQYSNNDNFYSNSVQLLSPEFKDRKNQISHPETLITKNDVIKTKILTPKSKNSNVTILTQSIKTASMILSGIIFLIISTYFILKIYTGKSVFKDIKQLSHPNSKENKSQPKKITFEKEEQINTTIDRIEEEIQRPKLLEKQVVDESAINSMLFDKKERQVRKMMNQKHLNYSEAEMVYNLSHGQLHG